MYRHILVALDGSAQSERILPWLRPLVQESGGKVRLLTVYAAMQSVVVGKRTIAYGHQLEAQAQMAALAYLRRVATYLRTDGKLVAFEARYGDAVEVILQVARVVGVDLIAMVTHTAVERRAHEAVGEPRQRSKDPGGGNTAAIPASRQDQARPPYNQQGVECLPGDDRAHRLPRRGHSLLRTDRAAGSADRVCAKQG